MIRLLHFSDIHFKYPECNDLETDPNTSIRDKLILDIQSHCNKDDKSVDAILITGDIAFAGKDEEYEVASNWIDQLCELTNCRKQDVYVVPGNHDVDRRLADSFIANSLRDKISKIKDKIQRDKALSKLFVDESAGKALFHPMQNYNSFASKYNCGINPESPHWNQRLKISEDIELNLRGITTTLFSSDQDDVGKLIVDKRQTSFRQEAGTIYLTMMHHPCDWLMDSDDIKDQLDNHIQIQLFGHKHRSRWDSGDNYIRISSISLHPDKGESGYEPGYNIIDISQNDSDKNNKAVVSVKVNVRVLQFNPMHFVAKIFNDKDFILKDFEIDRRFKPKASDIKVNQVAEKALDKATMNERKKPSKKLQTDKINMKDLSYCFYQLSGSKKRKIINTLNLLTDSEWELSEVDRQKSAFNRARESGLVQQLYDAIILEGTIQCQMK